MTDFRPSEKIASNVVSRAQHRFVSAKTAFFLAYPARGLCGRGMYYGIRYELVRAYRPQHPADARRAGPSPFLPLYTISPAIATTTSSSLSAEFL